jgi:hypothetical protein
MKLAVIISVIAVASALPSSDAQASSIAALSSDAGRGRTLFKRKGKKSHKHKYSHSRSHSYSRSHSRSYSRGSGRREPGRRVVVVPAPRRNPPITATRAPTRVVQQRRPAKQYTAYQGNSNGGQYKQYQASINNQAPIISDVPPQDIDPALQQSSSIRIVGSLAAVAAVFLLL